MLSALGRALVSLRSQSTCCHLLLRGLRSAAPAVPECQAAFSARNKVQPRLLGRQLFSASYGVQIPRPLITHKWYPQKLQIGSVRVPPP